MPNKRQWLILGATSIIAEEFAHLAAEQGQSLVLVGRDEPQLAIIAADLRLRFAISCEVLIIDFGKNVEKLLRWLDNNEQECDLFIAYSQIILNEGLTDEAITFLLQVNILSTVLIIHHYLAKKQQKKQLIFLSSVAACRGRHKNSLYGASKAAVEIYLEGLQQAVYPNLHILIMRLGFIDTKQTFGVPGIFYSSSPKACAAACWQALEKKRRLSYHPFFWRYIMAILKFLPFFVYRKIKNS